MPSSAPSALRILTVHYNTPELTCRLVRDIPRQTPRGRHVYIHILDNCSTPMNLQILQTSVRGLDRVTVETSDENLGFGTGINLLAENRRVIPADIVWLLNPDTRLAPGCLEQLEAELDRGEFAVVAPLIYSGNDGDEWIWYCGGGIDMQKLRPSHDLYGFSLSGAPLDTFETEFVTGAAPMMFAATFRTVGGFPDGYFLYWEDNYFSWKARGLGLRLGVVPSARLWHAVGASSGTGQSQTFYYWSARNRFTFAHDTGIPRRRLVLGRGGVESLRTVAKALAEPAGRIPKAMAALRGTAAGLRRARTQGEGQGRVNTTK